MAETQHAATETRRPDPPVRKTVEVDAKEVGFVEGSDGETLLRVPVSSTGEDRDGDRFTRDGLDDMLSQLETGTVKMFPDHGLDGTGAHTYRFYDIMGKWVGGEIDDGTLYALGRLHEPHPLTDVLVNLIEDDMPVGFSVGFDPGDGAATNGEGREFDAGVDLMEISPVGIESNPDAVIGAAVAKAARYTSADVDAEALATSIKQHMSESDTDTPVDEADDAETDTADGYEPIQLETIAKQLGVTEEEAMGVIGGHFATMFDDIMSLWNATEGDEEAFAGGLSDLFDEHLEGIREDLVAEGDGETDEADEANDTEGEREVVDESDAEDDYDDDEDDDKADDDDDEDKHADLREEIAELRATVERLESQSRESAGRKGIHPTEEDVKQTESTDDHPEPKDLYEEALALQGGD